MHPISAVQVEYSLFCLDIESPQNDILRTCRELGISIVAYSPIGRGLLTGNFRSYDDLPEQSFLSMVPKYSRENFPKILQLVAEVEAVAKKHNVTPSQVCLAWVLAQGEEMIPIPGTRTIKYLEQNTAAADLKFTAEEVSHLRAFSEATELKGDRYPAR